MIAKPHKIYVHVDNMIHVLKKNIWHSAGMDNIERSHGYRTKISSKTEQSTHSE